jgi:chromosome segregation ATPase
MIKEELNTPVMETTIEGAQKRITQTIEWMEWLTGELEDGGRPNPSSVRTNATNIEYIGVFLDTVGDEMAAISSAYNSLRDRYAQADEEATNRLEEIDRWKDNFEAVDMAASRHLEEKIELQREITELRRENGELRRGLNASLSSIHAAHDNR